MSRSLKKGPYINVSLEKKILAMNESGKKNVTNSFLSTLLRIWLAISSESSPRHAVSVDMLATRSNDRYKSI